MLPIIQYHLEKVFEGDCFLLVTQCIDFTGGWQIKA
jgi:hypothetical protein